MISVRAILLVGVLIAAPATFADTEQQTAHAAERQGQASTGDPAAGRALYQVCKTCHGEAGEGNRALRAPQIAGQADWYMIRQLRNFKRGVRGASPADVTGAQMRAMAMTLLDEQAVRDVVAFVGTLPGKRPSASIQGNAEHGREIFRQCAVCHGEGAQGIELFGAPRLNVQADWYLVAQLEKLKAGIRGRHPADHRGLQMSTVTALLENEDDVSDVVAYIGSLP